METVHVCLSQSFQGGTPPPAAAPSATGAHDPIEVAPPLPESRDPRHPLLNRDLDTGAAVKPGGYPLTGQTYADLLHRIAAHPGEPISPGIKADILAYYADPSAPSTTPDNSQCWAVVEQDLNTLRDMPTSTELPVFETYDQ